MARDFCILSMKRCGTTLLADLLNSHPDVTCSNDLHLTFPLLPTDTSADAPVGSRGFKILDGQNAEWLPLVLSRGDVPVVLLHRTHTLRHFYSCEAAARTATYHIRPWRTEVVRRVRRTITAVGRGDWPEFLFGCRALMVHGLRPWRDPRVYVSPRLHIDLAALRHFELTTARYFGSLRDALRAHGTRYLEVSYEELTGPEQPLVLQQIFDLIKVRHADLSTGVQRLNDKPLRALIENYTEVEAHCEKTGMRFD